MYQYTFVLKYDVIDFSIFFWFTNGLSLICVIAFQILIANDMAHELFAFTDDELVGVHLNDLVTLKAKASSTVTESYLEDTGEIVEVSGKVVCVHVCK